MNTNNEIQIYTSKSGDIELQVKLKNETIWLNREQMARLFNRDIKTIGKHINNIFNEGELEEKGTVAKFATVQMEGEREVKRDIEFYNLDVIISVGYRVKSFEGTQFRIWANKILKQYIINGYAINKKRLEETGYDELQKTLQIFQKTLKSQNLTSSEAFGLLDIITKYTNSWLLLQKYDEDDLKENGKTKQINYKLEAKEAYESLAELKTNLMRKHEATELFANPREENVLEGVFGNIYQTFDGVELYPSLEEKASNLLYFIIKDHPFSDGNKRSGAFLFILFLAKNKILFDEFGDRKINDRALVAITLLIAESDPKDKEIMVKLVLNLIN
ncbi:virulence protein RhuM/Fic/DOC family protein [Candidatus Gracilibacteria bacterium]|nr:virulence protein RhuM/Fic/DOC family protein [Candidatus Gracilibacteria bacterium]